MPDDNTPTPPAAPTAPAAPASPAAPPEPAGGADRLPDDHPLVKAYAATKAELAQKSQRLNEIDDANKTDAQKQADRITALETENTSLKSQALRLEVAAAKGVPAELISGSTKDELEAAADKLIAFRGGKPTVQPNLTPAGPLGTVEDKPESREDRRKRLAEAYDN